MSSLKIEFKKSDFIELDDKNLKINGCHFLRDKIFQMTNQYGEKIENWPEQISNRHEDLLINELILKAKGTWVFPYVDLELCHCRVIQTKIVDEAIISGAQTVEKVSRITSAGTACGTCKPNIEKILKYRLK